jgi:hypothetical protein
MGSRLRRALVAIVAFSLLSGTANAATKKPTPTPTKKVTAKASAKATPKVTAKATAKATAKTKTKPTAKATAKPTATATKKKVVIYKPKPRKKVKVSPSPKAVWPPKGYIKSDDIYAKVPTSKELVGLSSANKKLANDLKSCENMTCGAVLATSLAGCNWWEITGDVTGPTSDTDRTIIKYGSVTSLFGSSKPKEIRTFILVSEEPVKNGFVVSNLQMSCHRVAVPTDLAIPGHTYVKSN